MLRTTKARLMCRRSGRPKETLLRPDTKWRPGNLAPNLLHQCQGLHNGALAGRKGTDQGIDVDLLYGYPIPQQIIDQPGSHYQRLVFALGYALVINSEGHDRCIVLFDQGQHLFVSCRFPADRVDDRLSPMDRQAGSQGLGVGTVQAQGHLDRRLDCFNEPGERSRLLFGGTGSRSLHPACGHPPEPALPPLRV